MIFMLILSKTDDSVSLTNIDSITKCICANCLSMVVNIPGRHAASGRNPISGYLIVLQNKLMVIGESSSS